VLRDLTNVLAYIPCRLDEGDPAWIRSSGSLRTATVICRWSTTSPFAESWD